MIGHSIYQLTVILIILFAGHKFIPVGQCYDPSMSPYAANNEAKDCVTDNSTSAYYHTSEFVVQYPPDNGMSYASEHWSYVFNAFVMMQIFNEFNSRKLQTVESLKSDWREWIVFFGVQNNPVFVVIVFIIAAFQVIIVCFAYEYFNLVPLSVDQWMQCLIFGVLEWPVQFLVNAVLVFAELCFPSKDPNARNNADAGGSTAKVSPEGYRSDRI